MADLAMTGVGPYGMGAMGAMNDMSLLPLIQEYNSRIAQFDSNSNAGNGYYPGLYSSHPIQVPSFNYDNYWDQMVQNQDRMYENTIRQRQSWNRMDAEINGPLYGISEAADVLRDKVLQNEQDQIQEALFAYKQAIKDAYYQGQDIDDRTLTALAKDQYRKRFGTRLEDDIRNNANSNFGNGFVRTATFGIFGDKISAEENIAQINNQPVSSKSKTMKVLGKCTGALTTTAAGALIGVCCGGPVGAAIGAAVGLVAGIISAVSTK